MSKPPAQNNNGSTLTDHVVDLTAGDQVVFSTTADRNNRDRVTETLLPPLVKKISRDTIVHLISNFPNSSTCFGPLRKEGGIVGMEEHLKVLVLFQYEEKFLPLEAAIYREMQVSSGAMHPSVKRRRMKQGIPSGSGYFYTSDKTNFILEQLYQIRRTIHEAILEPFIPTFHKMHGFQPDDEEGPTMQAQNDDDSAESVVPDYAFPFTQLIMESTKCFLKRQQALTQLQIDQIPMDTLFNFMQVQYLQSGIVPDKYDFCPLCYKTWTYFLLSNIDNVSFTKGPDFVHNFHFYLIAQSFNMFINLIVVTFPEDDDGTGSEEASYSLTRFPPTIDFPEYCKEHNGALAFNDISPEDMMDIGKVEETLLKSPGMIILKNQNVEKYVVLNTDSDLSPRGKFAELATLYGVKLV